MANTSHLPAIDTLRLFPEINEILIELLKGLSAEEWHKPTVLPNRTVKDLASHILDGSLRRLSACRDKYVADSPNITNYQDLVDNIQKLNSEWIVATKRLSPQILIAFLEISETWLYEYFQTLDLLADAKFPVAWAGETVSANWFDIAREYTEKWHHQMQIRLAVNKPGISSEELFKPAIETFMRGLSHVYRNIEAVNGTSIKIDITGNGGGAWYLQKVKTGWELVLKISDLPKTIIELSDNIFWKLVTDSIRSDIAVSQIHIHGDRSLGLAFINMKAVMR